MAGNLFVKARGKETLEQFAQRMRVFLHLRDIERRESTNYVGEEYYKAESLAVIVKFALADEPDLEGFEFWIHLASSRAWHENRTFADGLADVIARGLTAAGDTVVRMPNAEEVNSRKIFYAVNRSAAVGSKDYIETTEA